MTLAQTGTAQTRRRSRPLGTYPGRICELMERSGADFLALTSPANVFYTTGLPLTFSSTNPMLFVIGCEASIFSMVSRDGSQGLILPYSTILDAMQHIWVPDVRPYIPSSQIGGIYVVGSGGAGLRLHDGAVNAVASFLGDHGRSDPPRIAVEDSVPLTHQDILKGAAPSATFLHTASGIMNELRLVKSQEEVAMMERSVRVTERAIRATIDEIRVGVTEETLWRTFKEAVLRAGGESWQHTTIAAGPLVHFPFHSSPTSRRLRTGDMVRFDVGAVRGGYTADIGRNAVIGPPTREARRLFETLREGEETAIDGLAPGAELAEVFNAGFGVVKKSYPEYRRGNIGHSIGIEGHEQPLITPTTKTRLEPGMLIVIEVPHYVENMAGFQVEDVLLITRGGHRRISTMSTRLFEC